VSLAKKAPLIEIGERLAADRLKRMGCRSARVKPWARKSANDHKSDCAPVSAMAVTSAWMSQDWCEFPVLPWVNLSSEMLIATLGCSQRRARFHSPLEKIWWLRQGGKGLLIVLCVVRPRLGYVRCFKLAARDRTFHNHHDAIMTRS